MARRRGVLGAAACVFATLVAPVACGSSGDGGSSGTSGTSGTPSTGSSALDACIRACQRGIGGDCEGHCRKQITPEACLADDELARAYDGCASVCLDQDYKPALAHCRGRNDAGLGVYCGSEGSSADPTGCSFSANCEGTVYELSCSNGTCACKKAGAETKTIPQDDLCARDGGTSEVRSTTWLPLCGYP